MQIRKFILVMLPVLLTACTTVSKTEPEGTANSEGYSTLNKTQAQSQASQEKQADEPSLLAETKQAQDEATREQVKVAQETEYREAQFQKNSAQPKPVGTAVCTWKNSFGYVAAVEEERMKINVQGRAPSATNGAFFSADTSDLTIDPQEATVWTDGSDWAVCDDIK